jgi:hypothetical protein
VTEVVTVTPSTEDVAKETERAQKEFEDLFDESILEDEETQAEVRLGKAKLKEDMEKIPKVTEVVTVTPSTAVHRVGPSATKTAATKVDTRHVFVTRGTPFVTHSCFVSLSLPRCRKRWQRVKSSEWPTPREPPKRGLQQRRHHRRR